MGTPAPDRDIPDPRPEARPVRAGLALLALGAVALAGLPMAGGQPATPPTTPAGASGPPDPQRLPDEVVLMLANGRMVQGLLVGQDRETLTVRVDGVDTPIRRANVQGMQTLPPIMDRYRSMRRAIQDDDTASLIVLTAWLRERGLYREALREIEPVLALEPFNSEAKDLERWLRAQVALEERTAARERTPRPERRPEAEPEAPRAARPQREPLPAEARFPTLTPEQINVMRVYEVDLDNPPRMRVDRAVIEELIRAYAGESEVPATQAGRERLLRSDPAQVLELMFRLRAREFYPRVQVLEDPPSIALFRESVHGTGGWLTNACASSRCHGGEHAGRLFLNNRRANSDATAYTNLLILDRFTLADGTPLIDYARPSRSPLLHMALAREVSLYPHPEVPGRGGLGWRPVFRSTEDRGFARTVAWIESMYTPRIGYPIDYTPPDAAPGGEDGPEEGAEAPDAGRTGPAPDGP